ncbi:MAG: UDP-3-O-(3-hydroxymyristoyl)glucosamine N-acyltransferase [Bacteroidota bacterium]
MMTVSDIAGALGADLDGDAAIEIRRVAKIEEAGAGDISFLANPRYLKHLETTGASAVIVGRKVARPPRPDGLTPVYLRVDDPYASFVRVLLMFNPPQPPLPPGIHPSAVVDPTAVLGTGVRVGPLVVIGERCRIGNGAMLLAGTVLGREVSIGAGSLLHANVTVREECRIGERVIIHSGTVIGSDGFGFAPRPDGSFEKIPQLGIVVIEDDVEIGANCAVDRATMGETRIAAGAKLDNLIQVAHNVVIGEHTVIAAQAGISGSTHIGKRNMIGGQVGFTGHLEIADDSKWGAQAGVHRSAHTPGGTYMGTPAVPFREASKIMGAWPQLPDALATIRELKNELAALKRELEQLKARG